MFCIFIIPIFFIAYKLLRAPPELEPYEIWSTEVKIVVPSDPEIFSDFTIVNLLLPKLLQNPHIYTGAMSKAIGF